MRILHVAHYDMHPHADRTFYGKALNGIEQWLTGMIENGKAEDEHYVLFFNHYEESIFLEKILSNGRATVYTYYYNTKYKFEELKEIFSDILYWLPLDIIHIHYLQPFTKTLPKILNQINFNNIVATMHDETFLGSDYGRNKEYYYDIEVADFFKRIQKVVFIHKKTKEKFENYYREELNLKTLVISNGVDIQPVAKLTDYNEDDDFKVLFLGTMHEVKGGKIVSSLANEQIKGISFYLLGSIEEKPAGLIDLGRYEQKNLGELVGALNPDLIAILSIVEETFSYTAAEATALGYPILCFNVGVLGTVEQDNRGFVVEKMDANSVLESIKKIKEIKIRNHKLWEQIYANIQKNPLLTNGAMAQEYQNLYNQIGEKSNLSDIKWEYLLERNLRNAKMKELQFLHKHHECEELRKQLDTEKMKSKLVPGFVYEAVKNLRKLKRKLEKE